MANRNSPGKGRGQLGGGTSGVTASQNDLTDPNYALPIFHYMEIPRNTLKAAPLTYDIVVPAGVINRVWVEFPRGCSGLAGVQLYRGPEQIFPLPKNIWLRSDNAVLNFAFTHKVITDPFAVTMYGYNEDDTYPHTIWVGLEMRGQMNDLPPQLQGLIEYITK